MMCASSQRTVAGRLTPLLILRAASARLPAFRFASGWRLGDGRGVHLEVPPFELLPLLELLLIRGGRPATVGRRATAGHRVRDRDSLVVGWSHEVGDQRPNAAADKQREQETERAEVPVTDRSKGYSVGS
jgi:hypothetical protein